jgi:glutaredoxin 3
MTGQLTVPTVFINGNHIGKNSDVQQLKNDGTLKELVAAVSAH